LARPEAGGDAVYIEKGGRGGVGTVITVTVWVTCKRRATECYETHGYVAVFFSLSPYPVYRYCIVTNIAIMRT
jgi:hypothetical protein